MSDDTTDLDALREAIQNTLDRDGQHGWDETARLADVVAVKVWNEVHQFPFPDSLDAAWAEAEAAATDAGLVLSEVYRAELGCLGCQPDGTCPYGDWWAVADRDRHDDDPVRAEGPTPAAALRALAEQLRRA